MENNIFTDLNAAEEPTNDIDRRVSRKETSDLHLQNGERRKIAFIGLNSGAGTTTIALSFAKYISDLSKPKRKGLFKRKDSSHSIHSSTTLNSRTSHNSAIIPAAFIDVNDENKSLRGMTYDRIGIDKRFIGREFISFYHLISSGQSVRGKCNPDMGINWALRVPGEEFERNEITSIIRLVENVQGSNVILDISGNYGSSLCDEARIEELKILLSDSDMIFVIIDPLPSSLMADRRKFAMLKLLESEGHSVTWVINKYNRGVNIKEMRNYLHLRNYVTIPFLDEKELYTAEYNCETMLSTQNSSQLLQNCFKSIAELHNFYMVL